MTTNLIHRVNVGDSLTRSAAARPAQIAIVDGDREWTYAEFNAWVNRICHGLVARGYTRGDATGGENVASIEVEKAVYAASAELGDPVAEAVVVGLPHERWSEAITAVVVPGPGATIDESELLAALKKRLDGYKVPRSVIVVDELPRTSTGKIQKNVVRDTFANHYGA